MHPVTRLFLVRHGEVESRYHRVFGGRIDMELSPRGHEQAKHTASHLRRTPFDAIYASPMRRVQQTLAPLRALTTAPVVELSGLREVDFGDWTGLGWDQVRERFGVSAFDWLRILHEGGMTGAESVAEFRARIEECLTRIRREQAGQTVAILCHGGVIRMMLSILVDLPLPKTAHFEIDYASITQVDLSSHKTEIQLLNLTPWRDLVHS